METTRQRVNALELSDAEVHILIDALESRIEHVMDWGQQQEPPLWRSPADRDRILGPMDDLVRKLIQA